MINTQKQLTIDFKEKDKMKEPNIYCDLTVMTGCLNLSLFVFQKWCFLDIRFSKQVNQIVLFNTELYFKYKPEQKDVK